MPSFRRRESVIDTDQADAAGPDQGAAGERARALAEEAEAEAAEAEATAAAARARARALRLRREAEAESSSADVAPVTEPTDTDAADVAPVTDTASAEHPEAPAADAQAPTVDAAGEAEADPTEARARRLPRPGWKPIAAAVCVLGIIAALSFSGFMLFEHRQAQRLDQQRAEYAAAARQAVVSLMSLDFNNAEEDVSRIIDNSTGEFRDDFESAASDFVQIAQESQVVTDVTVNSTAVQSMTDDTAEVLVAATSRVTNTTGAEQQPRSWRLAVSLQREGDQVKMSKVEFVP